MLVINVYLNSHCNKKTEYDENRHIPLYLYNLSPLQTCVVSSRSRLGPYHSGYLGLT